MSRQSILSVSICLVLSACSHQQANSMSNQLSSNPPAEVQVKHVDNPLLHPSTLPDQAPPFNQITDSDYLPALRQGMAEEVKKIDAIATNPEPPTFDNTLVAMEHSGEMLARVSNIFMGVNQADTNPERQKILETVMPELAAHQDAINLNAQLFARIKALYDKRDRLNLDPQQRRLLTVTYENFVQSGAQLSETDKRLLTQMNIEETNLTTQFHARLVAATNAAAVVVTDRARLDGLSEEDIEAAKEAANARGLTGQYVFVLQNTTQQPELSSLKDRALRAEILNASVRRAEKNDANDTRKIVARIAQLHAQKAKLLGYNNYAEYAMTAEMAHSPEAVARLFSKIVPAATQKARREARDIQKVIDSQGGGFKLTAADWNFYADQVRKQKFNYNAADVKPYLEINTVLEKGVFYAANQLYGLTFKQRTDIPTYHPDMKVYEVFDKDGTSLAIFYTDYYKRDSKSGGAWMNSFANQNGLTGQKPIVYNVCNFSKPAPGQPTLLSFDDVITMFHEFGHALHGMLSNVRYPKLSGTNTPPDFVEFPSQFNERWALDPKVLANYAKHYQTGKPMPQALVDKVRKASTFNQGYATTEYVASALLDIAWHSLPADAPLQDVNQFEDQALKHYHLDMPQVPPRYHTSYFDHIWSNSYAAGYYAYLWSEILADDAYAWFKEHGGLTRENGEKFRQDILSRGNSVDLKELYRDFRGRDAKTDALLQQRGLH